MKLKQVLSTTATAALLLGAPGLLLAQQSAGDLQEVDDDDRIVQPFNLSADRIDDMDVMTADGERVGEIEEILVDASGQPVAVTVEVDDLLDVDDEERIVRLDQLRPDDDLFATRPVQEPDRISAGLGRLISSALRFDCRCGEGHPHPIPPPSRERE